MAWGLRHTVPMSSSTIAEKSLARDPSASASATPAALALEPAEYASASPSSPLSAAPRPWTCPGCSLLCDGFSVAPADAAPNGALRLVGSDCEIAHALLARASANPPLASGSANAPLARASATSPVAVARVDGQPAGIDLAIERAAQILASSRQPLFGGLGLDVDGARALYPLACATGAATDGGASMLHGLRALQDRGQYTTTFAEVRNRAALVVCIGPWPRASHPEIWRRLGIGDALVAWRELAFVGGEMDAAVDTAFDSAMASHAHLTVSRIALDGDLFDTVSRLAACVAGQRVPASDAITALAARLRESPYSVLLWDSTRLPAQAALIVEALNAMVGTLNRSTRAAVLPLGSAPGASVVNQTFSWLSGLPLRSRAGPRGLEHEPLRFDVQQMLEDGSADALLWTASFGNEYPPPATALPTIVIGHAQMQPPAQAVFIPVATPGIDDHGHLYRVDGNVMLPLEPLHATSLPRAANVLRQITARVLALKEAAR